jgi:hypothetical protein
MTISNDYNDIKNFFSSYFHEDWLDEVKDPTQAISLYLAQGWDADHLLRLAEQIRRFTYSHPDNDGLEQALFLELGCYYKPSADAISAHDWLEGIALTLAAAAGLTTS